MDNTRNINRRSPVRLGWAVKHEHGFYLEDDVEPFTWNILKSNAKLYETMEMAQEFINRIKKSHSLYTVELYQS